MVKVLYAAIKSGVNSEANFCEISFTEFIFLAYVLK